MIARFLDWLLGPKCSECGQRVAPVDRINHPKDCSEWSDHYIYADEDEWTLDGFLAECDRVQDNPPPAPPGMELIECEAEPRHWPTYAAHVEGMYPAPCPSCIYASDRERIERLEHEAHHHRWQTWRINRWFAGRAYSLGLISGSSTSYNSCPQCPVRHTLYWRGRRSYILGKPRDWWACLRRGHRYSPMGGRTFALCTVCAPCPDCGSSDADHYACGGAA